MTVQSRLESAWMSERHFPKGGSASAASHPKAPGAVEIIRSRNSSMKTISVSRSSTESPPLRGYEQSDLLEGVIIVGASAMHAEIKAGAATLSF